ncbi:MAG: hypothetical protein F6K65_03520 [Moorea sp. SIO3C2]|nr:hypothetical protein [Moorena sp. SIO3C2]
MADNLNSLEHLEREIANYRSNFQQSFEVLDDLAQVQVNFRDLVQNYEALKTEHQALIEYIKKSKTEFAALQKESKSTMDQVVQTQDNFDNIFAEFKNTTCNKINQNLETFNQRFLNLESTTEKRLSQCQDDAQQALNSLQTQSKYAVNEIDKAQINFNQRFEDLEETNLEQIQEIQESLNQRFTTIETESETKWEKFQQQIDDDIRKLDSQQKEIQSEIHSIKDAQETLVKNTKSTRTIAYMATALSIIAVIITVLPSLLQASNEVKYPTVELPQISKPTK